MVGLEAPLGGNTNAAVRPLPGASDTEDRREAGVATEAGVPRGGLPPLLLPPRRLTPT